SPATDESGKTATVSPPPLPGGPLMDGARLSRFAGLRRLRRSALRLCSAGLPLLALGCANTAPSLLPADPPAALARPAVAPAVVRGAYGGREESLPPADAVAAPAKVLPISLEVIFRLAEEQNAQVRLARERVAGACADLDLAQAAWLPHVYVGPSYWRHEGGIQNEDGTLTHSSTGAPFARMEGHAQFDLPDPPSPRGRAEHGA